MLRNRWTECSGTGGRIHRNTHLMQKFFLTYEIDQSGKYRVIDDGRFSGHNASAVVTDRVHTVSFDTVLAAVAEIRGIKVRL